MARLAIVATNGNIDGMLLQVAPLFSVSQYMLCRPIWRRKDKARSVSYDYATRLPRLSSGRKRENILVLNPDYVSKRKLLVLPRG